MPQQMLPPQQSGDVIPSHMQHHSALVQPLMQRPPGMATITPQEAYMQDTAPLPPHAEKQGDAGVTMDQAIRGLHMAYERFRRAEAAYTSLRHVLAGKQQPPIISYPTGSVDSEGDQIIYELDLKAIMPQGVSEDERLKFLRQQLGPWNNYFASEYRKWLGHLSQFSQQAVGYMQSPPQ